jgi:hypothetical protein
MSFNVFIRALVAISSFVVRMHELNVLVNDNVLVHDKSPPAIAWGALCAHCQYFFTG